MSGQDLRSYLEGLKDELLRVKREVDLETQLGQLAAEAEAPVLFESLKGHPGWRLLDGLFRTRRWQARALGLDTEQIAPELAKRLGGLRPCRVASDAPVQELVLQGGKADVLALPVARHAERDGGRYIGAGMCITKDPDTGIPNLAMLRLHLLGPRRAAFAMAARHNYMHFRKHQERQTPMEMAVVIGHHPIYEVATNYAAPYGINELEVAGHLLGEDVEVVPCKTIGMDVPARAEIVIEGVVPVGETAEEGPFGEFQSYYAERGPNPIFEVQAITMRPDAIYRHIQAIPATDHQPLVSLPMEADIYRRLKDIEGYIAVRDVHIPPWGANFITLVQLTAEYEGQVRKVLMGALSSQYLHPKVVIAVDEDVDIYDAKDVMWAIGTRVDPGKDLLVVPDTRTHPLDYSVQEVNVGGIRVHHRLGGKIGIDATKPPRINAEARARLERARPAGYGRVRLQDFLS